MIKQHHNSLKYIVHFINNPPARVLKSSKCDIWQGRWVRGLGVLWFASCKPPFKTSKNETCWHDYQMSELVWKHSSITISVITPWKERYVLHIHILKSTRCFHSSRRRTTAGHEAEMSPVEHCCKEDANEQLLTGACLIKVGGLELWGPNLCLNCASSLWPWELLSRTECYLFWHLIHTHKWPLGAVFDKQTDWIACVNACGFSPSLSSRPFRMCPISVKDMENSTCMLT